MAGKQYNAYLQWTSLDPCGAIILSFTGGSRKDTRPRIDDPLSWIPER
jgi:hypothetical protein